jgi:uncharacterized protein (TIGR03437 family)
LAIFGHAAFAQSPLFTLGGTFPGGTSAPDYSQVSTTIVVADFNGDGKADIITANGTTLLLLLGDGTGNFSPAPGGPIAPGGYVAAIALGDVNGDGNPDLIASSTSGTTVLLGNGAGGFVNGSGIVPSNFHAGGNLITLADFNGDGKLDLITYSNGSSSLFPGDGKGAFGPFQPSPLSNDPAIASVVAADFNGDGKTDVAYLPIPNTNGGPGEVFSGDGTGRFLRVFDFRPLYPMGVPSAAADFNGDGKTDILTIGSFGNNFQSQVWSWTGNTSNTLTAFSSTLSSIQDLPIYVITGDFNGDGKIDWAGVNPGLETVSVYLGDGTGAFTAAPGSPYFVGGTPSALAAGDFNGDGRIDLAVQTGSAVVILLNGISNGVAVPSINPGGVVPVFSAVTTIQPGEWASIYGTNLGLMATWTGNFPETLGGTSVTIDGKAAYLWYVSPMQVNFQVPDDSKTGSVLVVVSTPSGTATSTVSLEQFAPSFSLFDSKHVAGIIVRSDGSGANGGGSYDFLGPTGNSLGFATVAAKAGDTVELFAVGLGPTTPAIPAGQVPSSAAPTVYPVGILIGNVSVTPTFAGLTEAGLYQINLTIPAGLGTGDVPLIASVQGVRTPSTVVMSLQ